MIPWRILGFMAWIVAVTPCLAQDGFGPEPVPGEGTTAETTVIGVTPLPPETDTSATSLSGPSTSVDRANARLLELRAVIEESLRLNPDERVRTNLNARYDLLKQDVREDFWFPRVSLEMDVSNHRYDRIYTSSQAATGDGYETAPGGAVGVRVRDYTFFNWGRDYLKYQNDQQGLARDVQRLTEARRGLRFQAIRQFFNLVRYREFVKIKREQLRQASFIHRLAREKLQLRKIPAMEYYQTRAEFLRAQTEYQQSLFEAGQEEERMANVLGDDYHPAYRTQEQLKYLPVGITADEALKFAMETSPPLRDARTAFDLTNRTYEKTLKDNLPLPRFSMDLGTWQQQFGPDGNSWGRSTNTGRNVEMVAAVNMSWTLFGEGGLFNNRVNKQAYLDKRIAEIRFYDAKRRLDVKIRTLLRTITYLEQKVTISDYQEKNARSNFDSTLDHYTSGRTTFPQIKLALDNWILSEMNTETVKYDHLRRKLQLAETVGLDDLPGASFDTLAVR